ncbi:J domain-containing protein [Bacillus sp. AK128]
MNSENYYKVLGLSETATDADIKKAYFKKIRQFPNETHPVEFQLLTKAYKILSDQEQRTHYDAQLEEQRAQNRFTTKPHPPVQTDTAEQHTVHTGVPNNQSQATIHSNQGGKKKKPVLQILLAIAVAYILYTTFSPSKEVAEPAQTVEEEVDSAIESVESSNSSQETEFTDEESETTVGETTFESETIKVTIPSEETIGDFLHQYFLTSVEVINGVVEFSIVEPFLDPAGKKLDEQRSYTQYLLEKGITEEFISMFVKDIQSNEEFIVVTTEETYDIFYSDGSAKKKSFESRYNLRVQGQQLFVNELLSTNELSSEDLSGPELTIDLFSMEQFLNNYLVDSVNAINHQDFSYVDPYLAYNSNRYSEQLNYTNYLIDKGITEELVNFELVQVEDLGDQTYEATTMESYYIYYADGTTSFKEFESKFQIIQNDNWFEVSDLIYTNEVQ